MHNLNDAFLGNLLDRLGALITQQVDSLLQDAGLSCPTRTISTVLLIGERQQISAADIAKELSQPHQLATQRVDLLLELGIIDRKTDPRDKRRKTLALTPKGHRELDLLITRLQGADEAIKHLYQEIGCDLTTVTRKALMALTKNSISERVAQDQENANSTGDVKTASEGDYKLWQNWLDY